MIHFDFDKSDIRTRVATPPGPPGDAKILDANADWLKANPNMLLLITGNCDERGTVEYNLALGDRRARQAMNYLTSKGVDASRISTISYGKERPICKESNEKCWAMNRNDQFLVKPK
jgi:peptidoglycan-associated lipoprotein